MTPKRKARSPAKLCLKNWLDVFLLDSLALKPYLLAVGYSYDDFLSSQACRWRPVLGLHSSCENGRESVPRKIIFNMLKGLRSTSPRGPYKLSDFHRPSAFPLFLPSSCALIDSIRLKIKGLMPRTFLLTARLNPAESPSMPICKPSMCDTGFCLSVDSFSQKMLSDLAT